MIDEYCLASCGSRHTCSQERKEEMDCYGIYTGPQHRAPNYLFPFLDEHPERCGQSLLDERPERCGQSLG